MAQAAANGMRVAARLRRLIETLLAGMCAVLLAALAVLMAVAVTTRKLGSPFGWYDEVASVLLAWLTWYGAALAALRNAHIGFPHLVERCTPRVAAWVVVLRTFVLCVFFAVVARYGLEVVLRLRGDTLVSLPWVPVALVQSVIPVGAMLYVLAELVMLPDRLAEVARRAQAPHSAQGGEPQ